MRAIRGAITVENNNADEILSATRELMIELLKENPEATKDMVSLIFTLTPDLDAVFPAKAARLMGITNVPLMCMSEIPVAGALEKCVRVLIYANTDLGLDEIKHVYMKGAVVLRPDLVQNKD